MKKYFQNSNLLAISLISLIAITCLISDILSLKSDLFAPLIITIIFANILTKWGIGKFKSIKLNQIIRTEGPSKHQSKSGTPNMGGVIIVPLGLIVANLININQGINKELLAISFLTIGFMSIGIIDDWRSFSLKQNTGLNPQSKIILQIIVSSIFLIYSYINNLIDSSINIFNNYSIEFNYLIWPIAIFILLAESNATNLTDGLDGLASGCGAIVLTGLSVELTIRGNPEDFLIASFCIVMSGAWLGFLLNNKNPAKIFMGDTGSLAMGALLGGVSLISNTLWGLLIMGIIFVAESLSVIIQVFFFKLSKRINGTGYRVFKMAPLHHHFEINGQEEIAIVRNFWIISISFVSLRLLFL